MVLDPNGSAESVAEVSEWDAVSINSRSKGAAGEREMAQELARIFGGPFTRTAQHCGKGGTADLNGCIDGIHWEGKWYARIAATAFMDQAVRDSDGSGRIPVVGMRQNRGEWLAMIRFDDLPEFVRCVTAFWASRSAAAHDAPNGGTEAP